MKKQEFFEGIKDGFPICLGYFSVSMAFGLTAVLSGLPAWSAVLISLTNLTSAGQFAGVNVLLAAGSLAELAVTTLIINMRYFLMSLSMSQKTDSSVSFGWRLLLSYGITDEVFAVSMQRKKPLSAVYLAGLMLLPPIGWTGGTLAGAAATSLMPSSVSSALGIALYAMFIAIIVPPARRDRKVMLTVIMAICASVVFEYAPLLENISGGWSIIIITLVISAVSALLFPIDSKEEV